MPNPTGKNSPFVIGNKLCVTHGLTDSPTYNSWQNMRRRCSNPEHKYFALYGGRGIKVCDRWNTFSNFLADMGIRPTGSTLDRIDGNGNYEPGNCRWAPLKLQNANKRTNNFFELNGIRLCLTEWCEMLDISPDLIFPRINRLGWDFERAIRTPARALRRRPA